MTRLSRAKDRAGYAADLVVTLSRAAACRVLCRSRGHRWVSAARGHVAGYYICTRCHEPGFWVPR